MNTPNFIAAGAVPIVRMNGPNRDFRSAKGGSTLPRTTDGTLLPRGHRSAARFAKVDHRDAASRFDRPLVGRRPTGGIGLYPAVEDVRVEQRWQPVAVVRGSVGDREAADEAELPLNADVVLVAERRDP